MSNNKPTMNVIFTTYWTKKWKVAFYDYTKSLFMTGTKLRMKIFYYK